MQALSNAPRGRKVDRERAPRASPQLPPDWLDEYDALANRILADGTDAEAVERMDEIRREKFDELRGVCADMMHGHAPRPSPVVGVEEMAERIYNANVAHDFDGGDLPLKWNELDEHYKPYWLALARAALSARPAPDEKLGTLPPFKTLNECREVFRRVAKRGPCLSSPDLHGIAAVRDFLTLDEEAFRRNWGPRDEDDDEKCEGGECRHGFDAGGGERLTECEKHGGKPAPSPQPAREAQGEPTLERCLTVFGLAYNEAKVGASPMATDTEAWCERQGIAAVRTLCLSRAPSPSPRSARSACASTCARSTSSAPCCSSPRSASATRPATRARSKSWRPSMTEHVDAPRKVVTITREEVHPRAQYAYAGNWRWVYSFEGLKKPLARLELAVEAAKKTYPGCKVELAWRAGGA